MRKGTKAKITDHLIKKGTYDAIDETLIDEYVTNIKYLKESKKYIRDNGLMISETRIAKGGYEYELLKKNPACDLYNRFLANLKEISTKLGLSPLDRKRLKLIDIEKGDDLSEFDL